MSAKRPLGGFGSQFQVMRNLKEFACDVTFRSLESSKFSFQISSSVDVIGHYGLRNGKKKTMVLEERADIDSLLTNGYGEAHRGCERMLFETLHKYCPHHDCPFGADCRLEE